MVDRAGDAMLELVDRQQDALRAAVRASDADIRHRLTCTRDYVERARRAALTLEAALGRDSLPAAVRAAGQLVALARLAEAELTAANIGRRTTLDAVRLLHESLPPDVRRRADERRILRWGRHP